MNLRWPKTRLDKILADYPLGVSRETLESVSRAFGAYDGQVKLYGSVTPDKIEQEHRRLEAAYEDNPSPENHSKLAKFGNLSDRMADASRMMSAHFKGTKTRARESRQAVLPILKAVLDAAIASRERIAADVAAHYGLLVGVQTPPSPDNDPLCGCLAQTITELRCTIENIERDAPAWVSGREVLRQFIDPAIVWGGGDK